MGLQHLVDEVESAETGSLGTNLRTAPFQSLSCQHSAPLVGELLVHTEEVANLTCSDSDVASRHVFRRTDDLVQLGHESLAEAHHLVVGTSADREVGASLAAAHRQSGKRVFESLFESEEL